MICEGGASQHPENVQNPSYSDASKGWLLLFQCHLEELNATQSD